MGSRPCIATLIGLVAAVPAYAQRAPAPPGTPAPAPQTAPEPQPAASAAPPGSEDDPAGLAGAVAEPTIAPPPAVPAPPPPPEPPVIVERGGTRGTEAALLVGAGAGIAAGACLFWFAHADDGDAAAAAKYEDYARISTRADRLRIASFVTAGAGIALGVLAIYRIRVSHEGTQLSVAPHEGGGTLVLERSW